MGDEIEPEAESVHFVEVRVREDTPRTDAGDTFDEKVALVAKVLEAPLIV
jgi:hypothetical protein